MDEDLTPFGLPGLVAPEELAAGNIRLTFSLLSIATQSAAFNARYLGADKLKYLVRTLLSCDEYGAACAPPDCIGRDVVDG